MIGVIGAIFNDFIDGFEQSRYWRRPRSLQWRETSFAHDLFVKVFHRLKYLLVIDRANDNYAQVVGSVKGTDDRHIDRELIFQMIE